MNSDSLNALGKAAREAGLPLIGQLVWFATPDVTVTPTDLAAMGTRHGFDPKDLPTIKNAVDAFRCATTPQQTRGESRQTRYLMRPVLDNEVEVLRKVVREDVDKNGRKLNHVEVASVRLERASGKFLWCLMDGADPDDAAVVGKMMAQAQADFETMRGALTRDEVHRWAMRQLSSLNHVPVHPNGALYFVPGETNARLNALAGFLKDVAGGRADFVWVQCPVLAVDSMVEQIKSGANNTITRDIAEIQAEVADLLQRQTRPPAAMVQERVSRLTAAMRRADEYRALLQLDTRKIDIQTEILNTQLGELLSRATGVQGDPVVEALQAAADKAYYKVTFEGRTAQAATRRGTVRVTANTQGWVIDATTAVLVGDLAKRPDVAKTPRGYRLKTKDPEVALLFVKNVGARFANAG